MNTKHKNLFLFIFCGIFLFGCATTPRLPADKILITSGGVPPKKTSTEVFKNAEQPTKAALLLPMTGHLASSGNAVRNGFLVAHYYAKQNNQAVPQIKFFDTNKGDVKTLYQRAVNEGSTLVVGPLTKLEVVAIADVKPLSISVLALNTVNDDQHRTYENLYQFGLSPHDEVLQIAYKIAQAGKSRALIIAPANSWGNDLTNTFKSSFGNVGGRIVDSMSYSAQTNFTKDIADFLKINQAQIKTDSQSALAQSAIDVALYRRTDFDVIFLIAKPEIARQIRPLLKFYYAGDIPVYSTSLVYSGVPNPQLDFDLDGIIFCDLPWILQETSQLPSYIQAAKRQITQTWPSMDIQSSKLFALGIDAYNLMRFLNHAQSFPANGLAGATGALFLDRNNHIYRRLDWAIMHNGKPRLLRD